jgi:hypothetical protein
MVASIFFYLVDVAIVNSFVLWKVEKTKENPRKNVNQLTFRLHLARQLISGFSSRKTRGRPASFQANKGNVPEEVRLNAVGKHFPVNNQKFRRCRNCSTKAAEKRTRFMCSTCDVPLCIDKCFKAFHEK